MRARVLGRGERLRLFFSYQRYALLMAGAPLIAVGVVAAAWPHAWYAWGPLGLGSLWALSAAATIAGRLPRKLRATLLADRRIAAGRFRPEQVRRYCGDPCFRVVAAEILRRAGMPRAERRDTIREFKIQEARRGHQLVLVDREGGVLFKVDGTSVQRTELRPRGATGVTDGG